jgi:hypothetical protein
MNLPSLSFHSGALAGVIVGAVLATFSGIVGNQYEAFSLRREKERSAALLFGEVLSTVRILLEGAETSSRSGDPFGPVTRRLLATSRREMAIYERNRESLVALQEAQLRSDIHQVALRIITALDALAESFVTPDVLAIPDSGEIAGSRQWMFGFLMENMQRIPGLTQRLGRIARHNFEQYGEAVRIGIAEPSVAEPPAA